MSVTVFDPTQCRLGEGPLWHPIREQLFWFDILGKRLLTREAGKTRHWQFDEHVSAAGWISKNELMIASETALSRFDLTTGGHETLVELEAENPVTRSNDGRADPWGGFWIGTMGKNAEPGAGKVYRYYHGEMRRLVDEVTISNAICFAPDRSCAYYSDTAEKRIMRQALEQENGWPEGEAEVFVDLAEYELNPDGAVVDAFGNLWNAQWGASRVAQYDAHGHFMQAVEFPASQISCPAFGGPDLSTLFATSAAHGLRPATAADGQTFTVDVDVKGQPEHQVKV